MRRPFFRSAPGQPARRDLDSGSAGAARSVARRAAVHRSGDDIVASLRVVVLPALDADAHGVAASLAAHGHDVTLIDWRPGPVTGSVASARVLPIGHASAGGRLRRLALLVPHRPDTWLAVGRRLRGVDAIVVPEATSRRSPARRIVLAAARAGLGRSTGAAARSGAHRMPLVLRSPACPVQDDIEGLLERLRVSSRRTEAAVTDRAGEGASGPSRGAVASSEQSDGTDVPKRGRPGGLRARGGPLRYTDITAHARPSGILIDAADADRVRRWVRRRGLRRADATSAWDAAGGLAALLLVDRGDRSATLLDQSGPRSPMRRWADDLGFDVIGGEADIVGGSRTLASLDVAAASVDVVTQLHPALVAPADLDLVLADAAWLLRGGGLLVLTMALVTSGPDAFGPAELRAAVARAHNAGFTLVGDVDADLGDIARDGQWQAAAGESFGLVRLALRRRS